MSAMSRSNIVDAGAQRLIDAHERNVQITVPEDIPLTDVEDAYAIQALVSEYLAEASGWKLGGIIKGEVPRYSRLFANLSQSSPARVFSHDYHLTFLEPELAVVLGEAIPRRDTPYLLTEIASRAATLHPAIEVVDSRFASWPEVPPLWQLADGLSHGSFVLGRGVAAGDLGQMRDAAYCLTLDDEVTVAGHGGHPGGDPAQLLVAMVNDRIARSGEGFRAGEVITTGTFNGVVKMFPGQRATLTFENIGSVELRLD